MLLKYSGRRANWLTSAKAKNTLTIIALELLIPAAGGKSLMKDKSAPRNGPAKFLAIRRATVIG